MAINDGRKKSSKEEIKSAILSTRSIAFYEKAVGLFNISTRRLYKPATFESWVEENLDIGASQAYNYIQAYELLSDMSSWESVTQLPTSEYHCRIIREFGFPRPMAEKAWGLVQEELKSKQLTGKLIEECFAAQVQTIQEEDPVTFEDVIGKSSSSRKHSFTNGLRWEPRGFCNWEWDLSDGDIPIPQNPVSNQPEDVTIFVAVSDERELGVVKAKAKINPNWLFLALMDFDYQPEVSVGRPDNLVLGAFIRDNDDVVQMLYLSQIEDVRTFAIFAPEEPLEAGPIADWLIFNRMDVKSFIDLAEQVKTHPCVYIPDNVIIGRHQFIARVLQ